MAVFGLLVMGPVSCSDSESTRQFKMYLRENVKLVLLISVVLGTIHTQVSRVDGQETPPPAGVPPPPAVTATPAPAPAPSTIVGAPTPLGPAGWEATQFAQFEAAINSLSSHINYTTGVAYLLRYMMLLPLGSTIFVPTNEAFDIAGVSDSVNIPLLMLYHAVAEQFNFEQLQALPLETRLTTLLANNTILITSTRAQGDILRVDNVPVVEGNLCISQVTALQISCHGVDTIFNVTEWGRRTNSATPSPAGPATSPTSAPNARLTVPAPAPPTILFPPPIRPPSQNSTANIGGAPMNLRLEQQHVFRSIFLSLVCIVAFIQD